MCEGKHRKLYSNLQSVLIQDVHYRRPLQVALSTDKAGDTVTAHRLVVSNNQRVKFLSDWDVSLCMISVLRYWSRF